MKNNKDYIGEIYLDIVNNTNDISKYENKKLVKAKNTTDNKIIVEPKYDNVNKNNQQNKNLETMNFVEYNEENYINYSDYEKLKNENEQLIETIKNLEKKYQNEIKSLKADKILLNKKLEELSISKPKLFIHSDNNIAQLEKNNNEIEKEPENNEKEIAHYKSLFQKYQNIEKDLEKNKQNFEKIIFEKTKLEHDYKEIKLLFENEKNKNIIKNIIIKEKNKELKLLHECLKQTNNSEEKFDFNNLIKLNLEKELKKEKEQNENNKNYGQVGIINNALTCYMNSVIQILKNIKKFSINILNYNKDDIITSSLRKILINLYYSNEKYISIYEFKKDFSSVYTKFAEDKENDSTLFLLYLLQHLNKAFKEPNKHISSIYQFKDLELNSFEENKLEKFLNKYETNNNSYINNLFYGYQMDKIICSKCDHSIVSFQSFNIINLPLIKEDKKDKKIIRLQDSLNFYLYTKDNYDKKGFECSNCGKKYISHLTCIIKLPQILIINLKRVGENEIYYHDIEIPFILKAKLIDKLSSYNKQYELVGFVKHIGNKKNGHHIAYSKNIFDNKWYSFDDKCVKPEEDFPSTNKSFLLFYQTIDDN